MMKSKITLEAPALQRKIEKQQINQILAKLASTELDSDIHSPKIAITIVRAITAVKCGDVTTAAASDEESSRRSLRFVEQSHRMMKTRRNKRNQKRNKRNHHQTTTTKTAKTTTPQQLPIKVFILVGQSNMQGWSLAPCQEV